MRKFVLLLLLTGLAVAAYSQDVLTGRVYENKSKVFLQGIRVENLKSHAITMTATDGSFTLKAGVGDLVTFTNFNYRPDTIFITRLDYLQVFLDLKRTMLQEVNVTQQQIKNGVAGFSAQPDVGVLGSNTVKYQRDDSGNYKGGVLFKIPDGGPTPRQREEKIAAKQKEQDKIRRVFNADTLQRYLPLRGQEMVNFVIMYMPDANTFFDPQFSLIPYLNTSYREFMKIPEDDRKSKSLTQLPPLKQ